MDAAVACSRTLSEKLQFYEDDMDAANLAFLESVMNLLAVAKSPVNEMYRERVLSMLSRGNPMVVFQQVRPTGRLRTWRVPVFHEDACNFTPAELLSLSHYACSPDIPYIAEDYPELRSIFLRLGVRIAGYAAFRDHVNNDLEFYAQAFDVNIANDANIVAFVQFQVRNELIKRDV
jgi:hypothetical protein